MSSKSSSMEWIANIPWWAWALIVWVLVAVVLAVLAAAVNVTWNVPSDARDVSSLGSSQCNSLKELKMYLADLRPDQCETVHPKSSVLEWENTWTNLGYLLAGILILCRKPRLLGIAVGANLCALALFSGLYHASLSPIWQSFDVGWIYGMLISLIVYGVESLLKRYWRIHLPPWAAAPLSVIPSLLGLFVSIRKYLGHWDLDSTLATGILLGALAIPTGIILTEPAWSWLWKQPWLGNQSHSDFRPVEFETLSGKSRILFFVYILASGGQAILFKLEDGCGHSFCNSSGPIQAHALWHVLGGACLWLTYDLFAQAAGSQDVMVPIP